MFLSSDKMKKKREERIKKKRKEKIEKVKKEKEKKEEREEEKEEKIKVSGVCVLCGKETIGYPLKDDLIIKGIRKIKSALKIARGTKLIVCDEDLEKALKKREEFEKKLLTYCGLGGIIGIIIVITSIISGRDIVRILSSLLLLILLIFIFLLFSLAYHFPDFENRDEVKKEVERRKEMEKEKEEK